MHLRRFADSVLRTRLTRFLLGGLAAFLVVPLMGAPAMADADFLGVLTATQPLSPPFTNSPGAYNISSGPATVVFTTMVENLTNHVVTVDVDLNVHQVMTYYGRNVVDGEPGKTGITFQPGDAPNTTQVVYGTPFERTLVVLPKGTPPQLVTFSTVMTTCGYFQFDIGKHLAQGAHDNLSSGFARVLGCSTGGTGGVSAANAGLPLAVTGTPVGTGLLGVALILIGGVCAFMLRRRATGDGQI